MVVFVPQGSFRAAHLFRCRPGVGVEAQPPVTNAY